MAQQRNGARAEDELVAAALEHARNRLADALPGSPEWDAAEAEMEDAQRDADIAAGLAPDTPPAPPPDASTLLHFAPRAFPDGRLVQGTFVGSHAETSTVHDHTMAIAARASSAREFVTVLERLLGRHGFALETQEPQPGDIVFYAWQTEAPAEV